MNEYHLTSGGEDQIRLAGEVFPVQAKTIAQLVYEAPNCHFGQRVLAADCSHVLAAIHNNINP
jgi:hypothetical protein